MLTVYGIETVSKFCQHKILFLVATVLTVYGIETFVALDTDADRFKLQQCLPFTVLKLVEKFL